MEKTITHLKWRQVIKNNKLLIDEGLAPEGTVSEAYHKSRASLYNKYDEVRAIYQFFRGLKERKTINEDYPVSRLVSLIEDKHAVSVSPGIVIAAMLLRGFRCDWADDPCFNLSGASKALK
jgi:hypothetical protein